MARPKKGTPESERASRRWRETMLKIHGSEENITEFFKRIGAKGGSHGHTGGYASNPVLAKVSGGKGGRYSKRGFKLLGEEDGELIYKRNSDGKIFTKSEIERLMEEKYGKRS